MTHLCVTVLDEEVRVQLSPLLLGHGAVDVCVCVCVCVCEVCVQRSPLLLGHGAVDGDGREVLLDEQLGERHAALHRLDEDDHLQRNHVTRQSTVSVKTAARPTDLNLISRVHERPDSVQASPRSLTSRHPVANYFTSTLPPLLPQSNLPPPQPQAHLRNTPADN